MKKILNILILIILIINCIIANEEDSLLNLLNKAQYDTTRVNLYNKLFTLYCETDTLKALNYFQSAVQLAEKINFREGIAGAYYNYSCYNADVSNYKAAIEYGEKAIKIFEQFEKSTNNDEIIIGKKGLADCYNNIGIVHSDQSNYPQAIEYYQKAAEIYEYLANIPDLIISKIYKRGLATCYNNIGIVYTYLREFPQAVEYHQKSLKIKEELKDKKGISMSYGNIGIVYSDQANYIQANEYFQKALKIHKELGNKKGMSINYFNIGEAYAGIGDYVKAIENYKESLKISEELRDIRIISALYCNLASLYIQLKKYSEALRYAQQSLEISKEIEILRWQKKAYENLAEAYAGFGNYKEAFNYHKLFKKINDSIFNEESSKQLKEMEARYQTEKKEREIRELKQKEEFHELKLKKSAVQRIFLLVIISLTIVLIIVFYSLYRFKTKTNKILESKNNQLEVLNATKDKLFSLIAHDLKNPLSAFRNISRSLIDNIQVIKKNQITYFINEINNSAEKLYLLLQNLLSWALSQTGAISPNPKIINMSELINNNLNLLMPNAKIKNIKLTTAIDENIIVYADEVMVCSILSNLLTNAIKFTGDNGKVTVTCTDNKDHYQFSVIDTGIGMSNDDIKKLFLPGTNYKDIGNSCEKGTGLGLLLCKELVEKNNGKIWAESKPGYGSSFIFTLPKEVV